MVRRKAAGSRHLMAHEIEHVLQYQEAGVARFLARYLGEYTRLRLRGFGHQGSYRRISAEITAEWRARRRLGIGCAPPDDHERHDDMV